MLLERVRSGALARDRLELAAYCGDEAALLASGEEVAGTLARLRSDGAHPPNRTWAARLKGLLERDRDQDEVIFQVLGLGSQESARAGARRPQRALRSRSRTPHGAVARSRRRGRTFWSCWSLPSGRACSPTRRPPCWREFAAARERPPGPTSGPGRGEGPRGTWSVRRPSPSPCSFTVSPSWSARSVSSRESTLTTGLPTRRSARCTTRQVSNRVGRTRVCCSPWWPSNSSHRR